MGNLGVRVEDLVVVKVAVDAGTVLFRISGTHP